MTRDSTDITNDLFHNCALWAYYEHWADGKQADSLSIKRRAYQLYEAELKNEKAPAQGSPQVLNNPAWRVEV